MWKWPPVVSGGDKSVANLVSSSAQAPLPAPLIQAVSPAACPLTTLLAHLAVINDYSRWEYSDSGWQTPCIQIIALFSQITLQSANHLIGTATKESFLCVGVPNLQPHKAWGMDSFSPNMCCLALEDRCGNMHTVNKYCISGYRDLVDLFSSE